MSSLPTSLLLDHPFPLPEGATVLGIADAAREAALAFLGGALHWKKSDLAAWLAGPYRDVTRLGPHGEAIVRRPHALKKASSVIDADRLEELVWAAHHEVLTTLRHAEPPQREVFFAYDAISEQSVARCVDVYGNAGWVPVNAEGLRLVDRVHSLLAVDCLLRPSEYLSMMTICTRCEEVVFDGRCRVQGLCRKHLTSAPRATPIARPENRRPARAGA